MQSLPGWISIVVTWCAFFHRPTATTAFGVASIAGRPCSSCSSSSSNNNNIMQRRLVCLFREKSKWDDLRDDDDDDDDDENDYDRQDIPTDMKYEPRNVKRAHQSFHAIRGAGGPAMTNDIYLREPKSDVFWYCGKVARVSDVSLEACVARQWPMIERHAHHLRPIELLPQRGKLEIWTAPGDSEMEVAYNRPTLQMQKMSKDVPGASKIKAALIGFQGEVYQEGEDGFRTWRTDEGLPARPEINPGGETRPPTTEESEELQRQMQGPGDDTQRQ